MKKFITIFFALVIAAHILAYNSGHLSVDDTITCSIGYFLVWGVMISLFFDESEKKKPTQKKQYVETAFVECLFEKD
jgi:hypothetical protein